MSTMGSTMGSIMSTVPDADGAYNISSFYSHHSHRPYTYIYIGLLTTNLPISIIYKAVEEEKVKYKFNKTLKEVLKATRKVL